jgi:hypothetical protein
MTDQAGGDPGRTPREEEKPRPGMGAFVFSSTSRSSAEIPFAPTCTLWQFHPPISGRMFRTVRKRLRPCSFTRLKEVMRVS